MPCARLEWRSYDPDPNRRSSEARMALPGIRGVTYRPRDPEALKQGQDGKDSEATASRPRPNGMDPKLQVTAHTASL